MLKKAVVTIILSYGLVSFSACAAFSNTNTFSVQQVQPASLVHGPLDSRGNDVVDKVEIVRLYSVVNGKPSNIMYRKKDLEKLPELDIDGYVWGIVVLCDEDMTVDIDGEELSRIVMNPDGTYSVKYLGVVTPKDLEFPEKEKTYYEKLFSKREGSKEVFLSGGYSVFPRVEGGSISEQSEFDLNFTSGKNTYRLPIRQTGLLPFASLSVDPDRETDDIGFRYVGNNFKRLTKNSEQFDARLNAIIQGIDQVEDTFGMDLVDRVSIIDYDDVYNAISYGGQSEIWFYVPLFRHEPLEELKTIAAHETLHVFVDKMGFAADSGVREYFADLKGYSDLSYERFILMMTGNAITDEQESSNNVFFSFINEKNFIQDMKGGHSQKNLEEFSTSFLHSLIYIDRLGLNLEKPLKVDGAPTGLRHLKSWEKQAIIDQYIRGIQVFLNVVANRRMNPSPNDPQNGMFLRGCLDKANGVRSTCLRKATPM
jgi:hypothetical protein